MPQRYQRHGAVNAHSEPNTSHPNLVFPFLNLRGRLTRTLPTYPQRLHEQLPTTQHPPQRPSLVVNLGLLVECRAVQGPIGGGVVVLRPGHEAGLGLLVVLAVVGGSSRRNRGRARPSLVLRLLLRLRLRAENVVWCGMVSKQG